MLTITVELVPGGFAPMRRKIASMRISNLSDLGDCSDYRVVAMEGANPLTGDPPRMATYTVSNHERRQPVWALIEKAAREILRAEYDEM
jgi:hypothetical protein